MRGSRACRRARRGVPIVVSHPGAPTVLYELYWGPQRTREEAKHGPAPGLRWRGDVNHCAACHLTGRSETAAQQEGVPPRATTLTIRAAAIAKSVIARMKLEAQLSHRAPLRSGASRCWISPTIVAARCQLNRSHARRRPAIPI